MTIQKCCVVSTCMDEGGMLKLSARSVKVKLDRLVIVPEPKLEKRGLPLKPVQAKKVNVTDVLSREGRSLVLIL